MEESKSKEIEKKDEMIDKQEKIKEESNDKKENIKNENVETVKNEAKETIKKIKDQMKDVNIKEDAITAKGFVTSFIKDPLEKIKEISKESSATFFKTALIVFIIWTVVYFFGTISFTALKYADFGKGLWMVVRCIITPAVAVLSLSLIIFIFNMKSESRKSLVTVITSVIISQIPIIISSIVNLLTIISSEAYKVTSRINSISIVLFAIMLFFVIKGIFEIEDDRKTFVKFAIIYSIYMIVSLVLSFIQISI